MRNETETKKPWLSPDDTVEALEVLSDIASTLNDLADYGAMRKDLRLKLREKSAVCVDLIGRTRKPIIEDAVLMALDEIARRRKVHINIVIMEALEAYVSAINRK